MDNMELAQHRLGIFLAIKKAIQDKMGGGTALEAALIKELAQHLGQAKTNAIAADVEKFGEEKNNVLIAILAVGIDEVTWCRCLDQAAAVAMSTAAANDLTKVDARKMATELREMLEQRRNNETGEAEAPYHLFFFAAVDRDERSRFFDIMKQEDGFSLAETATTAPRLGACVESVYEVTGADGFHHVHRNYGKYRTDTARSAMEFFAKAYSLTQLTDIAETQNQMEAGPIWAAIFQKLGCPASNFSFKELKSFEGQAKESRCVFTNDTRAGSGRPSMAGGGQAERPRPVPPPGPEMAAVHEQPAPEAAYKKGDVIGGEFEVHSLLGRGGFGEVYLVYNHEHRVTFALKTFRQKFLADAEVKESFKREALLWVNLEEHPFILAARGVEDVSGRLFVRMDYIAPDDQGRVTLADHLVLARRPLETNQAVLWASMFCYAMEHANQRGIKSHRDIKPTNILIRQDDTLLISDFGLAAAAETAWKDRGGSWESAGEDGFVGLSLFQTEGKQICGTPGYLAPEVFRGEGADVRSDVYSFGLVLWQMAAGSQVPPFAMGVALPRSPRDTDRYALEIYERQMRECAPAVGEPFEAVIERCLAPEPSKRFSSFTQLRAELEPILFRGSGQTVKLPPIGERSCAFWNNKGCSLLNLGLVEEAVVCLRKGLGINPDDVTGHINLGVALRKKGDPDGAIAEYRTALRLQPDRSMAHANLGTELSDKGDLDGAITEFRTALRLQPDLAIAHNGLGLALILKGDPDGAIAEYRTGLRLQPDDAWAHDGLGLALRKKGDPDGAIAEYRTALRLQPDDAWAHNGLGVVLSDKGDLDGAIAEYRTALRLQPDDADAHNSLGSALSAKGDLDGGIAEYRTAVRLRPDDAMAHNNLSNALWMKGDREAALQEFHRAYTLAPNEPTIRQTYENLMRQLKR